MDTVQTIVLLLLMYCYFAKELPQIGKEPVNNKDADQPAYLHNDSRCKWRVNG